MCPLRQQMEISSTHTTLFEDTVTIISYHRLRSILGYVMTGVRFENLTMNLVLSLFFYSYAIRMQRKVLYKTAADFCRKSNAIQYAICIFFKCFANRANHKTAPFFFFGCTHRRSRRNRLRSLLPRLAIFVD